MAVLVGARFIAPAPVLLAGRPEVGIARSEDGGQTWSASNTGLTASLVAGLTLSPDFAQDQTMFVASLDGGVQVSHDGGLTWAEQDASQHDDAQTFEPPSAPFEHAETVALERSPEYERDGTIYAATVASSTSHLTLWRSKDQGRRWSRWLELPNVLGGSAIQVVAIPANQWGDTVVLGAGGQVYRPRQNAWQVAGGARRPVWDAAALSGGTAAITGLAASPGYAQDRTLLAATSAGIYVSRDGGASFTAWSDGLAPVSTVAVAPSPAYARDRLVYALGLGGTVWRRRDA